MKKIWYILSLFLLVSCSSTKGFKGKADFCGILTDSNNHGVAGYTVVIDGNRKCVTNDSGVFVFNDVSSQQIHLSGYKNGYEKINCETFFYDENNFACFKVRTKDEVVSEVEICFENKDFSNAESLLDSIDYSEHDDKILFMRSVLSYMKNETRDARRLISKLKYEDENIEVYRKLLKK